MCSTNPYFTPIHVGRVEEWYRAEGGEMASPPLACIPIPPLPIICPRARFSCDCGGKRRVGDTDTNKRLTWKKHDGLLSETRMGRLFSSPSLSVYLPIYLSPLTVMMTSLNASVSFGESRKKK